jgi:hypothetical protein
LKADNGIATEVIHKLVVQIWKQEKVPKEWNERLLVKLPKKRDLTICDNWRSITLLNVISKILARIILERIKKPLEQNLRQNQLDLELGKPALIT